MSRLLYFYIKFQSQLTHCKLTKLVNVQSINSFESELQATDLKQQTTQIQLKGTVIFCSWRDQQNSSTREAWCDVFYIITLFHWMAVFST